MIARSLTGDADFIETILGQTYEISMQPILVIISGLPGTGKSFVSAQLAERFPFLILESDELRKKLYPVPTYSAKESMQLFRVIHLLIRRFLKRGISLILDATNLEESPRRILYGMAEKTGARLVIVKVEALESIVHDRMISRVRHNDSKSDADWGIYLKLKQKVESIKRKHYAVDTGVDIEPTISKIIEEIKH